MQIQQKGGWQGGKAMKGKHNGSLNQSMQR